MTIEAGFKRPLNAIALFCLAASLPPLKNFDGEPHSRDYIIKADEKKRNELKSLGYRVFSIHYSRLEDDMQKLTNALK